MAVVRVEMSRESQQQVQRRQAWPALVRQAIAQGLAQGLEETGAHLQRAYLRGGSPRQPRGGKTPLAVRSGALLGSVATEVDQPPYSGFVGTSAGPASAYARVLLQRGNTTITPRRVAHLWIPIADNLSASGMARHSPREIMGLTDGRGKRRARIFRSRRGNLVVFLPDPQGGTYTRGKNKGRQRGQLLFVLKKSVTVQGTDALAKAATDMSRRVATVVSEHLHRALNGESA